MMPGSVGKGAGKAPGGSCALLLTHWALGRVHWPWGEEGLRAARAWQLGCTSQTSTGHSLLSSTSACVCELFKKTKHLH